jgi:hypothetical protein
MAFCSDLLPGLELDHLSGIESEILIQEYSDKNPLDVILDMVSQSIYLNSNLMCIGVT